MFATYALLYYYGSVLIKDGDLTFQRLMISILTLMLGVFGLGQALSNLTDQTEGIKAAKRIFDIVDGAESDPISTLKLLTNPSVKVNKMKGKIEFKNVSFAYPNRANVQVCNCFDFVITPGECVAFVGPSGSG